MLSVDELSGVYVVVLNWNGAEDTARCLSSLQPSREAGATVLVVDNGSSDGSEHALRAAFPDVHLVQTGKNLGYTGGNNAGIAECLRAGACFVCVLNNDTVVSPDFLQPLVSRAAVAGTRRALSPVIRYAEQSGIWFAGGTVDRATGLGRHLQSGEIPETAAAYATELLTGCCLFADAAVWRAVGLFDDRFFLNFEDTQWSLRAVEAGIALEVVPASVIEHAVSASFRGPAAVLGSFYYARNGLTLQLEHLREGSHSRRFVMQHVLRPAVRSVRRREAGAWARLVVSLMGLGSVPLRRYGPAPGLAAYVARRA